MYDPYLCRWTTQDPANQLLNPYVYCGNNPVNFYDPDGEWFLRFFLPGIGNIIDGVLWSVTNYSIQAASTNSWTWSGFGQSAFLGFVSGQLGMLGAGLSSILSPFGAIPGAITQGALEGVLGGLGGGIGAAVTGGDFGQGFKQNFWNSTISGAASGGIDGYIRAAEFDLVNNWTGTGIVIDENYQTILGIRIGTPAQSDPSKYCYAHVGEFNSGVPYEEIIARMKYEEGADITKVAQELGGKGMTESEYGENIGGFGVKLREGYRVDATLEGKQYHNVAVTGIQIGRRWRIFGGGWGKQKFISADIWDPASGSMRSYRGKFRKVNSYSLPGDPIYRYLIK